MKVTHTDPDFVESLVQHATKTSDMRIIVADNTVDTKDEAEQTAIGYWQMGWNWDEIESILEDTYPDASAIVSHGLRKAKEYAKKVLEEGPFAIFQTGQKIKLNNGLVGTLKEKHEDCITVLFPDTLGTVHITAKQIDKEATAQLKKAYHLRLSAARLVNIAQRLTPEEDVRRMKEFIEQEKEAELPPFVEPAEVEFDPYFGQRAPGGYGPKTPMYEETRDVMQVFSGQISANVARIDALFDEAMERKKEHTEIQKWAKEVHAKYKATNKEMSDIAREVYVAMTEHFNLIEDDFEPLFFHTLRNRFLAFARSMEQETISPDPMHKVFQPGTEVYKFIMTESPELIDKIQARLDEFEEDNTIIREKVKEPFAMWPVPEYKQKTAQASWFDRVKSWVGNLLQSARSYVTSWRTDIAPEIEAGIETIDAAIAELDSARTASVIAKAIPKPRTF